MFDKVILHCDLNNFYASVECILHPELKGKAVAVCGDPEKRHGIVLAKSEIAKSAGVKTGEPIWQAKQKCPDLTVVPPTYGEYVKYSKIVREIYTRYTSEVESFGLDECWLDVTGSRKLFGSGEEIAESIRRTVKEETGGLTVSIGVSFTKVFAKLGSDLKKPDAISVISPENYKKVAWELDVGEMLFIGRATREKLRVLNINTIGDLARADDGMIFRMFGKNGIKMLENARGTGDEPVKCYTERHIPESIGNGTTTSEDITNARDAERVIYALSEMIAFRLRGGGFKGESVGISLRDTSLSHVSKQGKLPSATDAASTIARSAVELMNSIYDFSYMRPLRSITVCVFKLSGAGDYAQSSLFETDDSRNAALDRRIDKLRSKFGYNVVKRALNLNTVFSCDSREADDEFLPFDKHMKNLGED